jgi:hypothetical protein
MRMSVLHDKYSNDIVSNCFRDDVLFKEAMRTAFESALNIQPTIGKLKMAELVADLFDRELRKVGKTSRDEQPNALSMEDSLTRATEMFSYLRDKDIFIDAYRKQLAKRLLTIRSKDGGVSENDAIARLKERMGHAYTAKLEGMMNDIQNNEQRHQEFINYLRKPADIVRLSRAGALHEEMGEHILSPNKKRMKDDLMFSPSTPPTIGFDMRVQLLTNGQWPTTKKLNFELSTSVSRCCLFIFLFLNVVIRSRY